MENEVIPCTRDTKEEDLGVIITEDEKNKKTQQAMCIITNKNHDKIMDH